MATTGPISMEDYEKMLDKFVLNGAVEEEDAAKAEPTEPDFIVEEAKLPETKLEENTRVMKYSKLFGWDKTALKDMEDFDVVVYEDAYWSASSLGRIPNVSGFKHRVVDHTVM